MRLQPVLLAEASGGPLSEAHQFDEGLPEQRIAGKAEKGPIDVLVNNAALALAGDYLKQDPDEIDRTYQLNLVTPVQLCRQAVPRMLERGRGHIVNVSSMVAAFSFPGLTAYLRGHIIGAWNR